MDDAQSPLLRPEPTNPRCAPRIAEALGTRPCTIASTVISAVRTHEDTAPRASAAWFQHQAEGLRRQGDGQHRLDVLSKNVDLARTRRIRTDLVGVE